MVAHDEDGIETFIENAGRRRGSDYLYPVKLFGGKKALSRLFVFVRRKINIRTVRPDAVISVDIRRRDLVCRDYRLNAFVRRKDNTAAASGYLFHGMIDVLVKAIGYAA